MSPSAERIEHTIALSSGANLIPVLGLVAGSENRVAMIMDGLEVASYQITTPSLPATDSASVQLGFPVITVTQPVTDKDKNGRRLLFYYAL